MATRIVLGTLMLLVFGVLVSVDVNLGPPFPLTHLVFLGTTLYGALEIRALLPREERSHPAMIAWCLALVILGPLGLYYLGLQAREWALAARDYGAGFPRPWPGVGLGAVAALWFGFVGEIIFYRERAHALPRLAFLMMSILYLGVPAAVVLQIPKDTADHPRVAMFMLGLAILVPKVCDIGAYFTGRFLGRTKITPVLSPGKTLEGFLGGIFWGTVVVLISHFTLGKTVSLFATTSHALAFGLIVSIAGILGDLAESLLKRDLHAKDASQLIPGFGGILDVIDSILFGASVAWIWFLIFPPPSLGT